MLSDLVTFLGNASAVSSIVSSRIYPQLLPQKPTYPAITYNQVSAIRVEDLSGPAGKARKRISINCWAITEKAAHQLADAVRHTINGFNGHWADTNVGSVRLDNEFDFFEQEGGTIGVYRVVQDYIVAHLEA